MLALKTDEQIITEILDSFFLILSNSFDFSNFNAWDFLVSSANLIDFFVNFENNYSFDFKLNKQINSELFDLFTIYNENGVSFFQWRNFDNNSFKFLDEKFNPYFDICQLTREDLLSVLFDSEKNQLTELFYRFNREFNFRYFKFEEFDLNFKCERAHRIEINGNRCSLCCSNYCNCENCDSCVTKKVWMKTMNGFLKKYDPRFKDVLFEIYLKKTH